MAYVQRLSGEGVGLDFYIGLADGIDEGGLAYVGVSGEEDCALVGVDCGETAQVFSDFLQVGEGGADFTYHCANSTESGSFQALTSVEGVGILDKFEVVLAHVVDHVFGGLDVTECEFVVVFVV